VYFGSTDYTDEQCVTGCDAHEFALVADVDGSFSGHAGGSIISEENPALADTTCVSDVGTHSIVCPQSRFIPVSLENVDSDRGSRRLGSVPIVQYDNGFNRTYFSTGPFKDMCPIRTYFGQYPFVLAPGREYNISLAATMPSNTQVTLFSDSPTDVVLLRFFYSKPFAIQVFVGDTLVEQSTNAPTLSSVAGANMLDTQARTFTVVLRGNALPGKQVYTFASTNVVQLSVSVKVTQSEFRGEDIVNNMALLLGIPASRIRIANVHEVVINRRRATTAYTVDIEIIDDQPVQSTPQAISEQVARLETIITQISNLTDTGALQTAMAAAGYQIVAMTVTPPSGSGADQGTIHLEVVKTTTTTASVGETTALPESSSGVPVVAVGVGAAVGAVVIIVLVVLILWKRQQNMRIRRNVKKGSPTTGSTNLDGETTAIFPVEGRKDAPTVHRDIEVSDVVNESSTMAAATAPPVLRKESTMSVLPGYDKPPPFDENAKRLSQHSVDIDSPADAAQTSTDIVVTDLGVTPEYIETTSSPSDSPCPSPRKDPLPVDTAFTPNVEEQAVLRRSVRQSQAKAFMVNVQFEEASRIFLAQQPVGAFAVITSGSHRTLLVHTFDGVRSFDIVAQYASVRLAIPQQPDMLSPDTPLFPDLTSLVLYYGEQRRGVPFVLLDEVY
jgi:hypothetical protein